MFVCKEWSGIFEGRKGVRREGRGGSTVRLLPRLADLTVMDNRN